MRPDPKWRPATLLFTTSAGLPLRRTRFSGVWRMAAKAAGLPERVTFHDLCHYYASLLIQHGESVKVVQKRLGHKSAVETLDTYSHLWPDSEDRTREAVDLVLGAGGGPVRMSVSLLRTEDAGDRHGLAGQPVHISLGAVAAHWQGRYPTREQPRTGLPVWRSSRWAPRGP